MAHWLDIFKAKAPAAIPAKKVYTFGSAGLNQGSYLTDEVQGNRMRELQVYWDLYSNHQWVNRCVNAIAQAGSKAYQLIPSDVTTDAETQSDDTEEMQAFLNTPNPEDDAHSLLFKIHRDLLVFGCCFMELQVTDANVNLVRPVVQKALAAYKAINPQAEFITDIDQEAEDIVGEVVQDGIPAYLRVLPAQQMEVLNDDDGNITGYVQWKASGRKAYFSTDEIVHILGPNAQDPRYGESPLKPITTVATTDLLIDRRQKRMLQNDISFEYILSMPNVAEDEAKRMYEQITAMYRKENSQSSILVTTAELKPEKFSGSKDGDYLKQGMDNRDTICMCLGVPLSIIGIVDGTAGKGSGADSHLRNFIENTVRVISMKVETTLNRLVLNRFKAVGVDYLLRIVLEDTNDQTDVINNQIAAVHAGLMTVNEARAKLSMTPLPDGDDAFIVAGATVMPLSQAAVIPPPPPAPVVMAPHPEGQNAGAATAKPIVDAQQTLKKAIREMRKAMDAA